MFHRHLRGAGDLPAHRRILAAEAIAPTTTRACELPTGWSTGQAIGKRYACAIADIGGKTWGTAIGNMPLPFASKTPSVGTT